MSCNRHYNTIGINQICSGHGDCVNDFCYCDNGWTGLTDFEPIDGLDCDINILAIRIISVYVSFFGFITLITILKGLYSQKNTKTENNSKRNNEKLFLRCNIILSVCCVIIAGVIKAIDPVKNISAGRNVGSILLIIAGIGHSIGVNFATAYYILMIIKFLTGYTKMLTEESKNKVLKLITSIEQLIWPSAWIYTIITTTFYGLMISYQRLSDKLLIGFTVTMFISTCMNSIFRFIILSVLINELSIHLNSESMVDLSYIETVNKKLRKTRITILVAPVLVAFPNLIFGCSAYLRRKYIYLAELQCFIVLLVLLMVFKSTMSNKKDEKYTNNIPSISSNFTNANKVDKGVTIVNVSYIVPLFNIIKTSKSENQIIVSPKSDLLLSSKKSYHQIFPINEIIVEENL